MSVAIPILVGLTAIIHFHSVTTMILSIWDFVIFVINEDRVKPGAGFGTHPHRDMENITYVLKGALEHRDSMGNSSVIRPNEVQRMSSGTGIKHSEYNHSQTEPVHLLQIWILPEERGIK